MFNDELWAELVSALSESFRLDDKETQRLRETKIAKLLGALPFLSGSRQPMRTALDHLSTYLIALKGGTRAFLHQREDTQSVYERLLRISHFDGGDSAIQERGIALLALNMLSDYQRDAEEDSKNEKYNPIATGEWSYSQVRDEVLAVINSTSSPEMDDILTSDQAVTGFWNG